MINTGKRQFQENVELELIIKNLTQMLREGVISKKEFDIQVNHFSKQETKNVAPHTKNSKAKVKHVKPQDKARVHQEEKLEIIIKNLTQMLKDGAISQKDFNFQVEYYSKQRSQMIVQNTKNEPIKVMQTHTQDIAKDNENTEVELIIKNLTQMLQDGIISKKEFNVQVEHYSKQTQIFAKTKSQVNSLAPEFKKFISALDSNKAPSTVAIFHADSNDKLEMQAEFNERWKKRVNIAKEFMNHFQKISDNVTIEIQYEENQATPLFEFTTLQKSLAPEIKVVQQDGGEYAATLTNPLIVIAGNSSNIGGSAYRTTGKGAGDAQEEKFTDTYPIALAIAAQIGTIKNGEFKYPIATSIALEADRATLRATGITNFDGKSCDVAICVAPDLKNSKLYENLVNINPVTKKGETNIHDSRWDNYINEIYAMYNNLAYTLVKSDPKQPIVLTLPGSGVFSQNNEEAKLIQGICLRMAFESNPALKTKAKRGLMSLPYPEKTVMSGYNLDASNSKMSAIFSRVNKVVQTLNKSKKFVI